MERLFFFSYRSCAGPVGGGRGVVYKLYEANRKFHLWDSGYYCFTDVQFSDADDAKYQTGIPVNISAGRKVFSRLINMGGLVTVLKTKEKLKKASKWIKMIGDKYAFCEGDTFVFHDFESAYAFSNNYNFSKTYFVYHQQGSLYSEWKSFNGRESSVYRDYLNNAFREVCNHVGVLAFPSKGAAESLILSEPCLQKTIQEKSYKVLYNGFSIPEKLAAPSENVRKLTEKLKSYKGIKFITVAALNEAKGVERIPQYLSKIKKQYSDIKWVVVGNGIKGEKLQVQIEKYGLSNDVVWIKTPLKHDDILNLFALTDFYVLFHRFSIFDYATIEAMSFGNVPILTPVGGNKEVVKNGTGILVDNIDDISSFVTLLTYNDLKSLKERNITLQNELFSEEAFVTAYAKMLLNFPGNE